MTFQTVRLIETFATDTTNERPLLLMNPTMHLELVFRGKSFPARLALMCFLPRVFQNVQLHMLLSSKVF